MFELLVALVILTDLYLLAGDSETIPAVAGDDFYT